MTELKGIKLEDLNVTKETYINLICLLNPDLELPDDEHIQFSESYEKGTTVDIMFYHLLVYSDKLYCFSLCFCFSDLGNDVTISVGTGNCCNTLHFPFDYLYESEILKPVNEASTEIAEAEPEPPEDDAEELEDNQADELTPLERVVFEEIENCYERYNDYSELAKVAEYGAEYNGESEEEIARYGHLANEQIFNSDYLKELISKAGLQETYQSWLRERKNQEAVSVQVQNGEGYYDESGNYVSFHKDED